MDRTVIAVGIERTGERRSRSTTSTLNLAADRSGTYNKTMQAIRAVLAYDAAGKAHLQKPRRAPMSVFGIMGVDVQARGAFDEYRFAVFHNRHGTR